MSKKFSITDSILNDISKKADKVNSLEAKESFKIEYIDISDIKRNKDNFYEISDIDSLAEDIKINGLNHNLVVRTVEDGSYELISGERRYTAMNKLVNEGDDRFKKVPCKVVNTDDVDTEIILIQANAQTRELSETEKLKQVERLTELYKQKKARGENVGNIRKLVSEDLQLSNTQVGRYDVINRKLVSELKELIDSGELNISNASEFATLSIENQKAIYEMLKNSKELSRNEAKELKMKFKKIEEEKEKELKNELDKLKEKIALENNDKIESLKKQKIKLEEELKNEQLSKKDLLEIESINKKLDEEIKSLRDKEEEKAKQLEKSIDNRYKEQIEYLKNENKKNKSEKESLLKKLDEDNINKEAIKSAIQVKNFSEEVTRFSNKVKGFSENDEVIYEYKKLVSAIKNLEDILITKTNQEVLK